MYCFWCSESINLFYAIYLYIIRLRILGILGIVSGLVCYVGGIGNFCHVFAIENISWLLEYIVSPQSLPVHPVYIASQILKIYDK
jgi:hypothetical protein